jgi:predicted ATPase
MSIKRLTLKKLLSFNDSTVELGQLNVLIGPNAVGKSNLIDAVSLLQSAPTSIASAILRGGGIRQWLWLGDRVPSPIATLECELVQRRGRQVGPLVYRLQFSEDSQGFVILDEQLAKSGSGTGLAGSEIYFERSSLNTQGLARAESALARIKSLVDQTPITEVGSYFEEIRIFREFKTGPASGTRHGTSTSVPKESLRDGADNLAMVLHELDFLGQHDRIGKYLRRFCERFEDVKLRVGNGIVQAFLGETGLAEMLSAVRMSDGTLKFLCLLAALFHPEPPPLMCIEEPELGLHPDALQLVAEALVEASESMQLIVTTHSDALIDSLSERPEAVLVCERDFENGTQFKRLSAEHLRNWLEHYSLGQLWRKGEIGGGRW